MNWLTEFVRPKIRTLLGQREVPDNLWSQCSSCQQMIFNAELEKNLRVCTHCGHHMRVGAVQRLSWTFDDGTVVHLRIDEKERYAGIGVARKDGRLNGGCAAMAGKKRSGAPCHS